MMELYSQVVVFVFGAIVGSFLNVVIYCLHTGKSLNGRSHCLSCGHVLSWKDLFPLFSYVVLRARCRYCSAWVPLRYVAVELLTASLFALVWWLFPWQPVAFVFYVVLLSILVVIAVYDIRHTIIPNELTLAVLVLGLLFLFIRYTETADLSILSDAGIGAIAAGSFFWALWFVSKGRWMGYGDVKLAVPLGLMAGAWGALSMVVLSFWFGALVSIVILGGQTFVQFLRAQKRDRLLVRCAHKPVAKYQRYLTMKSEIPFAPFLLLGFLAVVLFHADIFDITRALLPL